MEEEERKERKKRERAQEALRKADRIRAAHEELAGERRAARMKSFKILLIIFKGIL